MQKNVSRIFLTAIIAGGLSFAAYYLVLARGQPPAMPTEQTLHEGVTYRRVVRYFPSAMIAHIVVIDSKTKGIQFLVTPADNESDLPLSARTTSQFLDEFGMQIAINGDAFSPWWSRGPADYYPHPGDPVAPLGFTASSGDDYWQGTELAEGERPTLYISRRNAFSFNDKPNRVYHAISGDRMLILKGESVPGLNESELEPRTAIGLNKNGRFVYLIVVDGRQPFYSAGITFADLARLLIEQGAYTAMSLDGGGSSTLVIEGESGEPVILNSPIDHLIPGTERPVANHLGVFFR